MSSIADLLREETAELPPRVQTVCDIIESRHPERVQAFIYYGSSLRELDNPEKMLDFYVCLLYTSPSPRDKRQSRMPSSA